ncbi:MAG: 4Fe-4S dicluster domain-containing protein [Dehalococcoidia bacterium]
MAEEGKVSGETDPLAKAIEEKNLSFCVECGKCVASCPMAEFYDRFSFLFSARGIIKKALLGLDILRDPNIWFCLKCDLCAQLCPAGVKYAEFVEDIRQLAIKEGITENSVVCPRCGRYYLPLPTLERLKEIMAGTSLGDEFIELCPQCRRDNMAGKLAVYAALGKLQATRYHPG